MNNNNIYKGIIHCHSQYSYDSNIKIEDIYNKVKKLNLNFIILTDHDTTKGSEKLREFAIKQNDYNLIVPLAAEYKTQFGDVIACFLKSDISSFKNDFKKFCHEARKQNALLLLPHPYVDHENIELLSEQVDLIEIFNSRVDERRNNLAEKIAYKFKKPIYESPDAHLLNEYGNSLIEVENRYPNLRENLLNSKISSVYKKKTFIRNIFISQIIKSIKKKKIKLLLKQIYNLVILLAKFEIKKKT